MAQPRRFVPARDGYWDGYAYEIDPAFPALRAEVERHRATHGAAGTAQANGFQPARTPA
jgi:1-acyl-sn-glycerol-3-phosphate acyltransferase